MDIHQLENSARALAFAPEAEKGKLRRELEQTAKSCGLFVGSIAPVYRGMASGAYSGFTVPAVNIRGLVFDLARAAFQAAERVAAGPFIFEIAPSELSAGGQTFDEYAGEIIAAALAQGWQGPVFLQGDHFHLESGDPIAIAGMEQLCAHAIRSGFYQIDIDASDLVGEEGASVEERLQPNAGTTAKVVSLVRRLEPLGPQLVLGGEVGRIGGELTTESDFREFLRILAARLQPGVAGLGKVSVNTGTQHGGLLDESGNVGRMPVDFELVGRLSGIARREFGLPGIVQHGASTMSLEQMSRLPGFGVNEVHLATAIQTTVFDHPAFPKPLRERMERELAESAHDQSGPETKRTEPARSSNIFREHGWLAWGRYKSELWGLPAEVRSELREAMTAWFCGVFIALGLGGREQIRGEVAPQARIGERP